MAQASETSPAQASERIAFVADTACDIPQGYLERFPFYLIPLSINYPDRTFLDRVDITPEDVFARMPAEIPSTSTPTPARAVEALEKAVADGYTHILCFSISSGLSSTYDVICQAASLVEGARIEVVDTLNIGSGAGLCAMRAADLLEEGASFDEILEAGRRAVPNTHIFFIPDTLEYLYKGGRISKAVYSLGTALNIKPIFTCDAEGKYAVCGKTRGRKKALEKALDLAAKFVTPGCIYRFLSADGGSPDEKHAILEAARKRFPDARQIIDGGSLSPALVVHTGPGLLGCVLQVIG